MKAKIKLIKMKDIDGKHRQMIPKQRKEWITNVIEIEEDTDIIF